VAGQSLADRLGASAFNLIESVGFTRRTTVDRRVGNVKNEGTDLAAPITLTVS
jgi:hypothetical protein